MFDTFIHFIFLFLSYAKVLLVKLLRYLELTSNITSSSPSSLMACCIFSCINEVILAAAPANIEVEYQQQSDRNMYNSEEFLSLFVDNKA